MGSSDRGALTHPSPLILRGPQHERPHRSTGDGFPTTREWTNGEGLADAGEDGGAGAFGAGVAGGAVEGAAGAATGGAAGGDLGQARPYASRGSGFRLRLPIEFHAQLLASLGSVAGED